MTCAHCTAAGTDVFVGRVVRRELKRYRRKGPTGTTRLLLHGLVERGVEGATLLDVGGGIGVIGLELLAAGARSATEVEASPEYVEAARREADRQGVADRFEIHQGDFVELAPRLGEADVVTLDRAICCYPDMPALVGASADRARRLCGVVLPREHVLMKLAVGTLNLVQRLRGSAFRVHLHHIRDIDRELGRRGLHRVWESRTWLWRVRIYRRVAPPEAVH